MKDEEKEEEEEEKKKEKVPSIGPSIRAGGGIRTSIRTIAGRRSSAGRWASIPAKPRACSTCKPITYSTAKWAAKRPASKPWPATSSESTPSTRISVPSPIKDRALLAILSSASNPTHWFFIFFYWKISTVTVSAITSISWSNASKCTRSRPSTIRPIDFQAITASRNSSKSFPVSVCVWVHPQLSLAVIQLPVDSIERVADNEACQCRLFSFTSLVLVFLLFFFFSFGSNGLDFLFLFDRGGLQLLLPGLHVHLSRFRRRNTGSGLDWRSEKCWRRLRKERGTISYQ